MSTNNYLEFLKSLAFTEATNNPLAVNEADYLGLYQMSGPALVDAGFVDQEATKKKVEEAGYSNDPAGGLGYNDYYYYVWTPKAKKLGINSAQDFLENPEAQTEAVKAYHSKQLQSMSSKYGGSKSINDYIKAGKPVKLGSETVTPTLSGILKATHLLGVKGVTDLLNGITTKDTDANGTKASKYFNDTKDIDLFSSSDITSTDNTEAVQTAATDPSSWRYLGDQLQTAPRRANTKGQVLSAEEAFVPVEYSPIKPTQSSGDPIEDALASMKDDGVFTGDEYGFFIDDLDALIEQLESDTGFTADSAQMATEQELMEEELLRAVEAEMSQMEMATEPEMTESTLPPSMQVVPVYSDFDDEYEEQFYDPRLELF